MLEKLTITNFKNFKDIVLDFGNIRNYDFNNEIIKNNIISKILILGANASGKSNIGLAIFDIINHLTDKNKKLDEYTDYLNYNNLTEEKYASFIYIFKFGEEKVRYEYKKEDAETVIEEKLFINDILCVEYNKKQKIVKVEIKEHVNNFENFNSNLAAEEFEKLSLVKYIKGNTLPKKNGVLENFFEFIDSMLWIRSLQEGNTYMGYKNGSGKIMKEIVENNKIKEFETFLNEAGIPIKLIEDEGKISVIFESGEKVGFYKIASSGTKVLALLFLWLEISMKNVSFLFIDEFDAYFHHTLSKFILKKVFQNDNIIQVALSSHSTFLISNEVLRPDCYYILNRNGKIKQLSEITNKKIEEYHNIEKMYRAEVFDYE